MKRYLMLLGMFLGIAPAMADGVVVHEYTVTNGVFEGDVEFPAVFRGRINCQQFAETLDAKVEITIKGTFPTSFKYNDDDSWWCSCDDVSADIDLATISSGREYKLTVDFGYPQWTDLDFEYAVGYETVKTLLSVDFGMGWFKDTWYKDRIFQQVYVNYWNGFEYQGYPYDKSARSVSGTTAHLNYKSGFPVPTARYSNSSFVGWSTGTNGAGVVVSGTTAANAEYTKLYAKWLYNYTIVFHSGCSPETTAVQEMENDQELPLADNTFVRPGYRFAGWSAEEGGEIGWTNRQEVINLCKYPGTNDLYAVWEDRRYNVEFDTNGGHGVMDTQKIGLDEPTGLSANTFARLGWTFEGWAENPSATEVKYLDGQVVTNLASEVGATCRLYAVWSPAADLNDTILTNSTSGVASHAIVSDGKEWSDTPVRVAIDPNGGVRCGVTLAVISNGVQIATTTDLSSQELLVEFCTGSTYELRVDASAAGSEYAYTIAIGKEGVDVVYDVGSVGSATGETNFNFTVGSPYAYIPTPSRTGFNFEGWADKSGRIVSLEDVIIVGVSETLTAKWDGYFSYVLEFDKGADDAVGTMADVSCTYGEYLTLPTNCFSRVGYAFTNWFNAALGQRYADKERVRNLTEFAESNAVLTAEWSPVPYIIRFSASSGVYGSVADMEVVYDQVSSLSPNSFVRAGYRFAGWSESEGGSVKWLDGAVVSNLCTTANDVKHLYPVWNKLDGVEVYSGRSDYGTVPVSDTKSAVFVTSGTNFTVSVQNTGKYRLSLDPQKGDRIKATVSVYDDTDGSTNVLASVSDLSVESVSYEFKSGTTYRFVLGGIGTNTSYAVGIGLTGVQVRYHGLAGTIADENRTFNMTTDFPVGFLPEFTATPADNNFVGWYDNSFWRNGGKVDKKSIVASWRPDVYAGWDGYEVPATLILDYGDPECGVELVTTNEFAAGFAINDLLPMPTCDNHSCIGWLEESTGKWWVPTDLMPTNGLSLTVQWTGEYVLAEDGLEGWSITGYRGTVDGELVIPETLGSRRVTAIGNRAFADQTEMTGVTFRITPPDSNGDGGFDFLDEDIELGAAAFSGCTALKRFELPLGVRTLPEKLFYNCTSLTNSFEGIPYTVTEIGDSVFSGCTALVGMTIPELVTQMGNDVFRDCSSLKIVRFLGSTVPTVGTNVYYHAKSDLVTGYLKVNAWEDVPDWATNYYRTCVALQSSFYQTSKVTLHYVDGGKTPDREVVYIRGRVFGVMLSDDEQVEDDDDEDEDDDDEDEDEDESERELEFNGWYTEKIDGKLVSMYQVISEAKDYYAHWLGYTDRSEEESSFGGTFYADDDPYAFSAATFNGYLMDGDAVAGTFVIKAAKGKWNAEACGTTTTFKVTIAIAGLKKVTLSGTIDADGHAYAENAKKGMSFEADLTRLGVSDAEYTCESGSYGDGNGARDRYSATSTDAKETVSSAMKLAKGSWSVLVRDEDDCWSVLSVVVGNKGKTKVSGTLADGTKVSTSSVAIVGDGCCCVPVVFSKRSCQFAFAIWFHWSDDGEVLGDLVGLSGFAEGRFARIPPSFSGECTLTASGEFDLGGVEAVIYDPSDAVISVNGSRWQLPKADKWKFVRDEGWVQKKDNGNETGLKLKYTAKNGQFKGSYCIYGVTESGKSKKFKATVTGGLADEDGVAVGYGSAYIKKIGAIPVFINSND